MTRRRRQSDDSGFTLIELLVVLALLGLLGAVISAGLHSAATGWRHIERHDADREERRNVQGALQSLLSQMSPARYFSSSRTIVQFSGGSREMSFIGPLPRRYQARDIVRYSLQITDDHGLLLSWRFDRRDSESGDNAGDVTQEVMADVHDGSFAYFGQLDGSTEQRWHSAWQDQTTLPRLIRLQFEMGGRDVDFLVAPRIGGAPCSMLASDMDCANLN